jgi:hypothetical protein
MGQTCSFIDTEPMCASICGCSWYHVMAVHRASIRVGCSCYGCSSRFKVAVHSMAVHWASVWVVHASGFSTGVLAGLNCALLLIVGTLRSVIAGWLYAERRTVSQHRSASTQRSTRGPPPITMQLAISLPVKTSRHVVVPTLNNDPHRELASQSFFLLFQPR